MSIKRRSLFTSIAAIALWSAPLVHAQDDADVQSRDVKRVLVFGDSNTWGYIP